jgi:carboxymethylenebutenolidase
MTRSITLLLGIALTLSACASTNATEDHDHADRMGKEHQHDTTAASPQTEPEPAQPVKGEQVQYATLDGKAINGYLAMPSASTGPLPAIIVIHEWWGLNPNIEAMTRRLAGEGYLVLAVDLYEGKSGSTPDEAMALMKASMATPDRLKENLSQGLAFLKGKNATKIASLGWCFGGGWSFQTAASFPESIDASVIYYGKVPGTAAEVATVDAPILGLFGGADEGIPVASVESFKAALAEAGKDAEIHIYEGAGHAFANPTGNRYQEAAAKDSWAKTTAFLAKNLK